MPEFYESECLELCDSHWCLPTFRYVNQMLDKQEIYTIGDLIDHLSKTPMILFHVMPKVRKVMIGHPIFGIDLKIKGLGEMNSPLNIHLWQALLKTRFAQNFPRYFSQKGDQIESIKEREKWKSEIKQAIEKEEKNNVPNVVSITQKRKPSPSLIEGPLPYSTPVQFKEIPF